MKILSPWIAISICAAMVATADGAQLTLGTPVGLELMQNVSARDDRIDGVVYARISHDVSRSGRILIAKGTVVPGRIIQAQTGRSGGMPGSVGVRFASVTAVDGQSVPLDARFVFQGFDRSLSAAFWGNLFIVPAMMSGTSPVMPRGVVLNAQVAATAEIVEHADDTQRETTAAESQSPSGFALTTRSLPKLHVAYSGSTRTRPMQVRFATTTPGNSATISGARTFLVAIDDWKLPEPVVATEEAAGTAEFQAWDIARHCRTGSNRLYFEWRDQTGTVVGRDEATLDFSFAKGTK